MNQDQIKSSTFNWNKVLKIGIGVVIGIILFRLIIFTIFFSQFMKIFSGFNDNFEKTQQSIHNKIEASFEEGRRDAERFDRSWNRMEKESAERSERDKIYFENRRKEEALKQEQDVRRWEATRKDWDEVVKDMYAQEQKQEKALKSRLLAQDKNREAQRLKNLIASYKPSIECEKKVFGKTTFNPEYPEFYSQQGIEDHFEACKEFRRGKST